MIMKILTYPDPLLRHISGPVEKVDETVLQLIEDMADAMYQDDGVGLAAPQIGVSKRVIVMDAGAGFKALINPEILTKSRETEAVEEGCLSLPAIRLDVTRPVEISVRALTSQGQEMEFQAKGLHARVIQHEVDHLNGVLIIDHAGPIQNTLIHSKLKKLERTV